MIHSIAFFVYPVATMKRARDFYERLPGLQMESKSNDERVEYDVAGTTFAVTSMDESHKPAAKGAAIASEANDLSAASGRLKAEGVRFTQENVETTACHISIVLDPDGNEIIIHQRKN
jgi:predicted enzyme related to lactoylglutathione lyase